MSTTRTVPEHDSRLRRSCRRLTGMLPFHHAWIPGALAFTLGINACGDFHLSTSDLDISPKPARPGDMVVASFILNLIPAQSHTMIVVIDSTEHMRVTSSEAPRNPVILELGDAADLIAQYGAGEHAAYVRVRANESDEATRTRWAVFQLDEDTP